MQRIVAISVFTLLFLAHTVFAQKEFGEIQGTVKDQDQSPVPGVSVTASSSSLIGGSALLYTDEGGSFRFPALAPGVYEVRAELDGFNIVVQKGVQVFVGNALTVDFQLEPKTVAEEIVVVGEAPQLDATTAATSNTVRAEIIQNLPKPQALFSRNILSLLALTPGVGEDQVAFGAPAEAGNRIWVDGVDVTSPQAGLLYAEYAYNWIEEVQVVGIGAPAEYGGFTGVVGNYVTRSGGNQFHGLMETFFQNQNLVSTNTPDPGPEEPFKSYDVGLQIGGPILKDKLWFFSGLQYPYLQNHPFGYDGVTTEKYTKFITKLTYKPNADNIIQGFGHYNHYLLDGEGASAFVPFDATYKSPCEESSWNATWISLLSDQTTWESRFGGLSADCRAIPRHGDISGHIDFTGAASVNALTTERYRRFRPQVNASLSHYAQDFLGTHDFKFGVQFERSEAHNEIRYNGGFYYYDYYGYPYYRFSLLADQNSENKIHRSSVFVQDDWNLSDRITLNLGIRWDHNRGSTDRGMVFATDPVAPRIGLVWRLNEKSSTVFKAHYGDYYDALTASQFQLLTDSPVGYVAECFNYDSGQWEPCFGEQFNATSDSNLRHPFVRQFTAGIDHDLSNGLTFGVHYIHRKWENFLHSVDNTTQYESVPFVNPITGETITVFERTEAFTKANFLTNPEGLFRKYNGLEIVANARFLNHLSLSGSFVYSRVKGNVSNAFEDALVFSGSLNDPNKLINFDGRLLNDPSVAWKIAGVYTFPGGFNAGWFLRHQSGDTWTPRVLVQGLKQGAFRIFGLPRGSNRLPSQTLLDVRIEKQFSIYQNQLRFTADIFNVFNNAYATAVNDRYDTPSFGEPTDLTQPRAVRLGIRYTF